jgi:type VII secretion protein EssB
MQEKEIHMESNTFHFTILDDRWALRMPKSQTRVKDIRHLSLLTENRDYFIPAQVEEEDDTYTFFYTMKQGDKHWKDVQTLNRTDKLRLLCNLARLHKFLSTRITFFMHPDNLIWDDNLMPSIIHRGIRDLVPPFEVDESAFFQQYKCLAVAMFSKKFNFDELYTGSIHNATDTDFEKQISGAEHLEALIALLEANYIKEKAESEKSLQLVPRKKFRLFKQLSFSMIAVAVILIIPLIYLFFNRLPEQNHLLQAHTYFLTNDYGNVISELESNEPEDLPYSAKYILAYSYIQTEKKMLNPEQKEVIMKNISMKSDENYLLYWVYNGRGNFTESMDLAMYVDDPTLILYGLLQQIEAAKNDPDLSGTKREEKIQKYEEQLNEYTEKSGLDPQSVTNEDPVEEATPVDGSIPVEEAQPMEQKVPSEENQSANKEENEKTPEKEASKTDKADNKAKD